jgi:hypothetical protein
MHSTGWDNVLATLSIRMGVGGFVQGPDGLDERP